LENKFMCGIVGYIGHRNAAAILLAGLEKLEYRGYDSAGLAVHDGTEIHLRRAAGKLEALRKVLLEQPAPGHCGIAHTRWATHGEPSEINAHPHSSNHGSVMVCHNGIIENAAVLRRELEESGTIFKSQTDTEVLPHLIAHYYFSDEKNFTNAVRQALARVHGSYAMVALHRDYPEQIIAARKLSPLVIGFGEDENFCASDVAALLGATSKVLFLDDGEMAIIEKDQVQILEIESGNSLNKTAVQIEENSEVAEKEGYAHFMLKEIHEQPRVIERLLSRYVNPHPNPLPGREREHDHSTASLRGIAKTTPSPRRGEGWGEGLCLDDIGLTDDELRGIRRIFIQACGTSWHAGLVGKLLLERLPMIAVDVDTSSEFRYRNVGGPGAGAILSPDTLVIAISQSGETADTLAGIREARSRGLKVLSVVNVPGSTIARESDGVVYSNAGPEIGVASTKAYIAQLGALYLLSLKLAEVHNLVDEARLKRRLNKLQNLIPLIEEMLQDDSEIRAAAELVAQYPNAMFMGRGYSYPAALEGALKLKEISYIHAEGFAAGELKHGPLALVDENMPVIAIAPQSYVYEKMLGNIAEVCARRGRVIAIAGEDDQIIADHADKVIRIPELTESFSPFLVALPLQLLAYHVAVLRGCDVDRPRNLAKSVTVE
jgi:glucosamine--fructose-6-phosphate aminotransferase (isomerizing)